MSSLPLNNMFCIISGLGFPGMHGHHLPHIKQELDRPPHLIPPGHGDDKHDSPKKKVIYLHNQIS